MLDFGQLILETVSVPCCNPGCLTPLFLDTTCQLV
jgi:hypothetical protein